MVLPTLQSYSATKHLTTPQNITEIETDQKIEKPSTRVNSAQSKWASPISGILKDDALRDEQEKHEKLKRLETRRSHLSEVLETDKNKHQSELNAIRQSSREKDFPIIGVKKSPNHRINENVELHSMDRLSLDSLDDDYPSEERQTERQIRIVQLKIILQRQMNELKQKEDELKLLKQEEQSLRAEQQQLEEYQQERKLFEKPSIQQESSRQLLRQHKAKLHKHSKEIQEELQFDMKIIASIVHGNDGVRLKQIEEQDRFRRDALKIFQQFEQQINSEKEREQIIDEIYPDEAAKQWSLFEQQWTHESQSRKILLDEFFQERQNEILNRLQTIENQIEEIEIKQQTLINDMEQARKYQLIEKEKHAREIEEHQPRTPSTFEKPPKIEIDRSEQKPTISKANVEPKFYGRRRVNWN